MREESVFGSLPGTSDKGEVTTLSRPDCPAFEPLRVLLSDSDHVPKFDRSSSRYCYLWAIVSDGSIAFTRALRGRYLIGPSRRSRSSFS
jgi:hypothetical protein